MALRITNAVDLHCHFGPDTFNGSIDDGHAHSVTAVEAAREAAASGHAALVLKPHAFPSPVLARNIETVVPGLRVFGGMCTDHPSGGLTPRGVEIALTLGAKIIWLPTVHSQQDFDNGRQFVGGPLPVIDGEGRPLPVVREIADLVREHDAVLATGHTTTDEHYVIVREFARRGKVLVTHAGEKLAGPRLTPEHCVELAALGASIELTAQSCKTVRGHAGKSPAEMVEWIQRIGPEHCTLSSDYGWSREVPKPAPGLREFYESLWSEGLSEATIQRMASTNPARLLGMEFA